MGTQKETRLMDRNPSRAAGEHGSILILSAACIVIAMIASALAVDLGRLASDKRTDQKVADLAALDASRDPANADCLAKISASGSVGPPCTPTPAPPTRNKFPTSAGYSVTAVQGTLVPSGGGSGRVCQAQAGAGTVCVTVSSPYNAAFPFVTGPSSVTARAVAGIEPKAQVSVGSDLANFDTKSSPVLNPVLTQLLGLDTAASLALLDYQGLTKGSVSLNDLVAADSTLGSPVSLLSSSVNLKKIAAAAVTALTNKGDAASLSAETALALISAHIDSALKVKLGDIVGVQQPADGAALSSQLNVFDLIVGAGESATAAKVANGTNFVDVPGLTVGIPGLASSTLRMWIIQAPQISALGRARCTPPVTGTCDTVAGTAQVKLDLSTHITVQAAPVCVVVCTPGITLLDLGLPISIAAAKATASLTAIPACAPAAKTANVRVDTEGSNVTSTASITTPNLGSVPLTAIPLAAGGPTSLVFTGPPFPTAVQSGAAQNLNLVGLTSGVPLLADVKPLLDPVLASIDTDLFQPLFKGLGLSFAGADTRVMQILCGVPGLVQ